LERSISRWLTPVKSVRHYRANKISFFMRELRPRTNRPRLEIDAAPDEVLAPNINALPVCIFL